MWNAEDEAPSSDYGPMHIGILGFGTFGRFLAERLVKAGHHVTATSRTDYAAQAQELGVTFFNDVNDFCEDHPEIVILATSILSFESVRLAEGLSGAVGQLQVAYGGTCRAKKHCSRAHHSSLI